MKTSASTASSRRTRRRWDSLPPWFSDFEGGQFEGSTLTVVVPNSYAANHLNESFGEDLVRMWRERSGEEDAVVQEAMDLSKPRH